MKPSLLDVLEHPPQIVDCGTCPVNIACAIERGGSGWAFDCCGSTSVWIDDTVNIIDCQKHKFERHPSVAECKLCPLCSGDLMTIALRDADATTKNRYVPTEHAKIPLAERLRLWRKVLPEHRVREKKRREEKP